MPKQKIQRTLKEEKEFQQRRNEKRAENQRRRHQIAKLSNNIPKSINYKDHIICIAGTIRDNRIIELDEELSGQNSGNTVSIYQRCSAEYLFRHRSWQ